MFGSKVIKKAHIKAAALAAEQPFLQTLCHSRSSSIVNFDARLLASPDCSQASAPLLVGIHHERKTKALKKREM